MGNVVQLPIRADEARRRIRAVVVNTGNVFIPTSPKAGEWEAAVTYRQVIRCLENGELISEPKTNEYRNCVCELHRTSAGVTVTVTVVIFDSDGTDKLMVTKVGRMS